jgi:hypothetical protein
MGTAMSTAALILAVAFGEHTAADVILVAIVLAAGLESVFAVCVGCRVYAQLERIGLVPACEECADITSRRRAAPASRRAPSLRP